MAVNMDWAIKLAIEHICARLPPETVAQVPLIVEAGIGIKKQLDRIEFVQVEILKLLQAQNASIFRQLDAKPNGASPIAGNIEPSGSAGE